LLKGKENHNSISQIRNSIVHQNMDRKDMVEQDIKKLEYFLKKFRSFFGSSVTK